MTFNLGAYKLRQKVLIEEHEVFVHVPDGCPLLLLVNSSRRSTFAERDSPSEAPNWEAADRSLIRWRSDIDN